MCDKCYTDIFFLLECKLLSDLNIFDKEKLLDKDVFVKVRSTGKLIKAEIKLASDGAEINLKEIETGVSPGQACVFYLKNNFGDKVLGGGWIVKAVNNYLST